MADSCLIFLVRLIVKLGLKYDLTNVFYMNGFVYIFVFESWKILCLEIKKITIYVSAPLK